MTDGLDVASSLPTRIGNGVPARWPASVPVFFPVCLINFAALVHSPCRSLLWLILAWSNFSCKPHTTECDAGSFPEHQKLRGCRVPFKGGTPVPVPGCW